MSRWQRRQPKYFPSEAYEAHHRWLDLISLFDGAICISRTVADELHQWLQANGNKRERPFRLDWFHLGADVKNSKPTSGLSSDAEIVLQSLAAKPTFLSVGTLEPRKGHMQTLASFEQLWRDGIDVNLVMVGKQGWMVDALVAALRDHPENGKRLYWLDSISDEYLVKIYEVSTCLIAASEGEGFGLPLIESAQYKLPIIARDIPVFFEVGGKHVYFFENDLSPSVIAKAVKGWLALFYKGEHPKSELMPVITWGASVGQLVQILERQAVPFKQWPDFPKNV